MIMLVYHKLYVPPITHEIMDLPDGYITSHYLSHAFLPSLLVEFLDSLCMKGVS